MSASNKTTGKLYFVVLIQTATFDFNKVLYIEAKKINYYLLQNNTEVSF